ncbi:hypothetical protein H0O00_01930 [Candidatus Micrarchaeota archaeon]|nr:hypothetical protein [Candidatus Micrarchaeota archaeon]
MRIPLIYLKDKQAFSRKAGFFRMIGKPIDLAREFKASGYELIHIVDQDAISGLTKNLDVYDGLTYIINVQVECAPDEKLVHKLLTLRCRVVLPPSFDVSPLHEKRLLVAKIPKDYTGDAEGFHDVVLEDATDSEIRRFAALGKRVIIYDKDEKKVEETVWGVITSSF